MPSIKITDGDRVIEFDDAYASLKELYVIAADALDHEAATGMWLPRDLKQEATNNNETDNA